MDERWYRSIKLKMTIEQFHKLPRDVSYKYEYIDGKAWLTPTPKQYHARLELARFESAIGLELSPSVVVRRLQTLDWEVFPQLFSTSFWQVQPFASLGDEDRDQASRECLEKTRNGGDGPLIEQACMVAIGDDGRPDGAALVTITPDGELDDVWSGLIWHEPPPQDWLQRRVGRPHLTWVFVPPMLTRSGIGSALLAGVVQELRVLGYHHLVSTFLLGNHPSCLWHWRNGFKLAGSPGLRRLD